MKIISTYLIISFLLFSRVIAFEEDPNSVSLRIAITEAPFILTVVKETTQGTFLDCMATLIHKQWAITSCQCLKNVEDKFIAYGISDMKQFSKEQILEIEEIIYHPGFHSHININDIAIVKFKKPVQFTNKLQKIDLEAKPWPGDRKLSRNCVSYRFGQGRLKLRSKSVVAKHGEGGCYCYPYIRNICLEIDSDDSLCDGDFGGPLICDGKLVGIANTIADIETCDGIDKSPICGAKDILSIYTFTCPYLHWIKNNIRSSPSPPASCDALRKYEISNLSIMILALILHHFNVRKNLH